MNYITLIGDWQQNSPYLATLKGQIYKMMPDSIILDVTHSVEVLNMNQTSFILKKSVPSFPKNSVNLILTGVSSSLDANPIVAKYHDQYYIGYDSGIFSLLFFDAEDTPEYFQYASIESDFISKMLVLCKSCIQNTLPEYTEPYETPVMKTPFLAMYSPMLRKITGQIAFVDAHHNIVTNIPLEMFLNANKTGKFSATVGNTTITHFHETYVEDPEPFFLPNSFGVLEIAVFGGRLALLSSWQQDTSIDIYFNNI